MRLVLIFSIVLMGYCAVGRGEAYLHFLSDTVIHEGNYTRVVTQELKTPAENNIWDYIDPRPEYVGVWPIAGKSNEYFVATYLYEHMVSIFDAVDASRNGRFARDSVGSYTTGYNYSGTELSGAIENGLPERNPGFARFQKAVLENLYARHGNHFVLRITPWQVATLNREDFFHRNVRWKFPGRLHVPAARPYIRTPPFQYVDDSLYLHLYRWPVQMNDLLETGTYMVTHSARNFVREGGRFEPRAAIVYPVRELPGVYVLIANRQELMNRYFLRLSNFSEGGLGLDPGIIPPLDYPRLPYGLTGPKGHDIRGKELIKFYDTATVKSMPSTPEEQILWSNVIAPLKRKHGQNFVLLGLSIETAGKSNENTLWHELLHGQHFLSPELDGVLRQYWDEHPRVQEVTLQAMTDLTYSTADPYINRSEMWAYALDPDSQDPARLPVIRDIALSCAQELAAAARAAGVPPITDRRRLRQ